LTSRGARPPEFATFWHGPLNAMAYGCLASFAHAGVGLRVYGYDDKIDLPGGVDWVDARRICPDQSLLQRYIAAGKPSLAKFADMFRYKLIRETGCCWFDTDIICLRKPDFSREAIVFGRQADAHGQSLINNAVLKLPSDHPMLAELIGKAEDAVDIDQSWGAIGPFLLTPLAAKYDIYRCARAFFHFYPIEPEQFWKPLLPDYCESVVAATKEATFLHLWSELFERCAYDKSACPPVGSFLHEMFQSIGALHRFERVYDERELRGLLAGWMPGEDQPDEAAV
jgi:hypothetical protein